jgi:hypothetical protein
MEHRIERDPDGASPYGRPPRGRRARTRSFPTPFDVRLLRGGCPRELDAGGHPLTAVGLRCRRSLQSTGRETPASSRTANPLFRASLSLPYASLRSLLSASTVLHARSLHRNVRLTLPPCGYPSEASGSQPSVVEDPGGSNSSRLRSASMTACSHSSAPTLRSSASSSSSGTLTSVRLAQWASSRSIPNVGGPSMSMRIRRPSRTLLSRCPRSSDPLGLRVGVDLAGELAPDFRGDGTKAGLPEYDRRSGSRVWLASLSRCARSPVECERRSVLGAHSPSNQPPKAPSPIANAVPISPKTRRQCAEAGYRGPSS